MQVHLAISVLMVQSYCLVTNLLVVLPVLLDMQAPLTVMHRQRHAQ